MSNTIKDIVSGQFDDADDSRYINFIFFHI